VKKLSKISWSSGKRSGSACALPL